MNVAVLYKFHDREEQAFVLDTDRLRQDHKFEKALRAALLRPRGATHVQLGGDQFGDDWGDIDKARVQPPCTIGGLKIIHVFWDC